MKLVMFTGRHIIFFLGFVSALFSVGLQAPSPGGGSNYSLIIGCGSDTEEKDADGRKWLPDSKYVTASNSVQGQAQYQDPSLNSEVPYMKARIFTSNATYKLPAKSKQRYFLRLHFYPSTYGSHNAEQAYFSVVANGVTLLQNFSASLTCKALTQAYIVKEYSLAPLAKDGVEVAFSINADFAFVNGIELVAAPDALFDKAVLVGKAGETIEGKDSNVQTMYRLNVGGNFISPTNDSGSLGRAWYDDNAYIFGANLGVTNGADKKVIEYKDIPDYSAPVDIYTTARSMGPDPNVNLNSNLTWVFNQVDPKYMYLVRLHFCDTANTKPNQIAFTIYINNQTAEAAADVIGWSGGIGKAIYKDYVTIVNEKNNGELWLALHPNPESKPQYYDAMLSGVEIFKLETSKSLAGLNPKLSDMLQQDEEEQKRSFESQKKTEKGTNKAQVIGGAAGGAAAFGIAAALCIAVYQRKKRVQGTESQTTSWLPLYGNSHTSGTKSTISGKSNASSHLSSAAQGRCRRFSFIEMKQATKNFDEANVIGVGGFGKVYKGVIENGATKVAIKRSNPQSEQGVHEFQTEIEMLSELRHKHLVSLIGFCDEDNEMCLVYDYMSLGTLREHIYKGNKTHLSWKQRLEICIGAAKGLHYLHTGARWTIIHRDVKTTNILLDENWEAKVSDFGLSKTGPDLNKGHVSTVVKGSFGYLDPEYFKRQQLTEKSDVYSFGVVLFEVLCARPALNPSLPKEQVSLADWALHCQKKGILEEIIDPHLKGKVNMESIKKFADTAEKCLSDCGVDRPSLNDILWNLEFALQLQDGTDGGSSRSGSRTRSESDDASLRNQHMMAIHYSNLSLGSDSEIGEEQPPSSSNNEAPDNDSAVFSQIINPTGR